MDGSITIVFLLVSYGIYYSLKYNRFTYIENTKIEYTKVPPMCYKRYREYLKSEEWKDLREFRFIYDNYKCVRCGTKNRLQCHHTNYYGIETMDFYISQLETVCIDCHKAIHKGELPMKKDNT